MRRAVVTIGVASAFVLAAGCDDVILDFPIPGEGSPDAPGIVGDASLPDVALPDDSAVDTAEIVTIPTCATPSGSTVVIVVSLPPKPNAA